MLSRFWDPKYHCYVFEGDEEELVSTETIKEVLYMLFNCVRENAVGRWDAQGEAIFCGDILRPVDKPGGPTFIVTEGNIKDKDTTQYIVVGTAKENPEYAKEGGTDPLRGPVD